MKDFTLELTITFLNENEEEVTSILTGITKLAMNGENSIVDQLYIYGYNPQLWWRVPLERIVELIAD